MTENPVFLRELRRLRFRHGRWPAAMLMALPIALWGIAVPLLGVWGPWPPVTLWDLGFKVVLGCYLAMTVCVPMAVTSLAERDRRNGTTEALRLASLAPGEEEHGRVLSVLVPLAVAAAVATVGHLIVSQIPVRPDEARPWALPRPPSLPLALVLALIGWSLFTAHVHFVALLSVRAREASDFRGMGMLGMILVYALGIDLICIGPLVKLLCLFEIGPARSRTPPGLSFFLRREAGGLR